MAITVGSLLDQSSDRVQELINTSMMVFLEMLSPVWKNAVLTSQGVGNPSGIGRDLEIIKSYMGSYTGVFEAGDTYGNIALHGEATSSLGSSLMTQTAAKAFPDALDGVKPDAYRLRYGIRSMVSNIVLTTGERDLDALPATVGQVVMPILKGHGKLISHSLQNMMYVSQNTGYSLCTVGSDVSFDEIGSTDVFRIKFTCPEDTTRRLARGMRVDLYSSLSGRRSNDTETTIADQDPESRTQLVVESVAHFKNEVTLITPVDPTTGAGQFLTAAGTVSGASDIAGFYVVPANSQLGDGGFKGIPGFNSWFKGGDSSGDTDTDANTLLGTTEAHATDRINVNIHPEFQSYIKNVGGTLTEETLTQILETWHAGADQYGFTVDTGLAARGVLAAYRQQKIGQFQLDRTGRPQSLMTEGARPGLKIEVDGRSYTIQTDPLIEDGTMYWTKTGGQNWKIYTPPSGNSGGRMNDVESKLPFELMGDAIGGVNNRLPVFINETVDSVNRNRLTNMVQMPGRVRMTVAPDQPNGIKLTGLTTSKTYAD